MCGTLHFSNWLHQSITNNNADVCSRITTTQNVTVKNHFTVMIHRGRLVLWFCIVVILCLQESSVFSVYRTNYPISLGTANHICNSAYLHRHQWILYYSTVSRFSFSIISFCFHTCTTKLTIQSVFDHTLINRFWCDYK